MKVSIKGNRVLNRSDTKKRGGTLCCPSPFCENCITAPV